MTPARADATVLRGRILIQRTLKEAVLRNDQVWVGMARADAETALSLARSCAYPWAEYYALDLLADTSEVFGDADQALAYRRGANALGRRLWSHGQN
jgi:hypothetical protein